MEIIETKIADVKLLRSKVFKDERGFFEETYVKNKFLNFGIIEEFVQDNHSGSRQNVLRGMHYQIKNAQGKLIKVVKGEIFDVAVDLRKSSPTFGKWVGVYLCENVYEQLWIPAGFAHGFFTVSEWAEVFYKTTNYYSPEHERTLIWNDPDVGIEWPTLPNTHPELSAKDQQGKKLSELDLFD